MYLKLREDQKGGLFSFYPSYWVQIDPSEVNETAAKLTGEMSTWILPEEGWI